MIRHVVLLAWKTGMDSARLADVRAALRSLMAAIPGILSIEEGPSSSPEGLEQGFTYGFVVTFADAEARDVYLPHPQHTAFVGLIGPYVDRVVVYDINAL